MELFHIFTRRQWYRKKRFVIPSGILAILIIAAIILGAVLGSRSTIVTNTAGMYVDTFSNAQTHCVT
jgi:hypothetical protein